jgi:hypothetical protein
MRFVVLLSFLCSFYGAAKADVHSRVPSSTVASSPAQRHVLERHVEFVPCSSPILSDCKLIRLLLFSFLFSVMNNWWFRVVVHHNPSDSTLKFEHPTLAGTAAGGWMERLKAEGQDVLRPSFGQQQQTTVGEGNKEEKRVEEVKMTKEGVDRKITQEELDAHNSASEPWFVVNGEGACILLSSLLFFESLIPRYPFLLQFTMVPPSSKITPEEARVSR